MNVYDFDHTIYNGDSSVDFSCFYLRRHLTLLLCLPVQFFAVIGIKLGFLSVKHGKELFFSFLKLCPADQKDIMDFWKTHSNKMTSWYLEHQQPDDLIISASPEFLLQPFIESTLKKKVIATKVDSYSGKILGENCKGDEKVRLFFEHYPAGHIECFYSDSMSDTYLANIATCAFLVKNKSTQKAELHDWPRQRIATQGNLE